MSDKLDAERFDVNEHPHIRFNPLKDEWILVSPHRTKRPWKGQVEKPQRNETKRFDPTNPLCPGVTRPNGVTNPEYKDTYVFDNDFPALFDYNLSNESELTENNNANQIKSDLFKTLPAKGCCKVMCFHPYSDLTLPTMDQTDIVKVIKRWIDLYIDLREKYDWIQIFENKGEMMGCSNMHPHCQVWASSFLPNSIQVENRTQLDFYKKHNKVMLVEYLNHELESNERIVIENKHWVVLVPYWALWPYEVMILPKRHIIRLDDLNEEEIIDLADTMKRLLIKYDNLFECSFPYSMGFHFAPSGRFLNDESQHWQLFASYLPPLLRSSTVRKFMVGYELLAQAQRDLSAEKAAEKLRELSGTIHYLSKSS